MDIITKIKTFIEKLYRDKYFKFIVFVIFMLICLRQYSNITSNVKKYSEVKTEEGKPMKVNTIKYIADTVFVKTHEKEQALEKEKQLAEKKKLEEERRILEEKRKEKEIEDLKKEFTQKKSNKKKIVRLNDTVKLKMIITNGDDFNIVMQPITMELQMTKDKANVFTKYIVGKRVDDVAIIPIKAFVDQDAFKKEVARVQKAHNVENIATSYSIFETSPIIYRVKILEAK